MPPRTRRVAHSSSWLPHAEWCLQSDPVLVSRLPGSGAILLENTTAISIEHCRLRHIGGNAIFLSNSVEDTVIKSNDFSFLGTSGVAIVGKTGAAMMDARDGEWLVAKHGLAADNGVRLPKNNTVSHNIFSDYGIWDKQSCCYHKALAPGNVFLNNVCFNASRHAVNFQDSMGGRGVVEGNLFFNLNRETLDTSAANSWGAATSTSFLGPCVTGSSALHPPYFAPMLIGC